MKNQNFGIEIEMTGITRSTAAKVVAGYFHTDATHVGGCYDAYSVRDNDGRMWKIMRDASVDVKIVRDRMQALCTRLNLSLRFVITMTLKPYRNLSENFVVQERESTQAVVSIAI